MEEEGQDEGRRLKIELAVEQAKEKQIRMNTIQTSKLLSVVTEIEKDNDSVSVSGLETLLSFKTLRSVQTSFNSDRSYKL